MTWHARLELAGWGQVMPLIAFQLAEKAHAGLSGRHVKPLPIIAVHEDD